MKVFLAMMSHETTTFSNIPTDCGQFEARNLHYGGGIVETFRGTGTCLGGMIEATERLLQVAAGRIRPTAALRTPPILPPLGNQVHSNPGPFR